MVKVKLTKNWQAKLIKVYGYPLDMILQINSDINYCPKFHMIIIGNV